MSRYFSFFMRGNLARLLELQEKLVQLDAISDSGEEDEDES